MQNIQDVLTNAIIVIVATCAIAIALDLFVGLINLWKHSATIANNTTYSLTEQPNILTPQSTIATDNPKPLFTNFTDSATDNIVTEDINIQSLENFITKLSSSHLRTVARRLGIADKLDGRYKGVAILRKQLKEKLSSQPSLVARVLTQLMVEIENK
ncbi:MAG: aminoglycoside phosphotransferase [Calothrix sp. SM1_7_51]|nr:aminoglycoside phosphotransferase [Calothrix sp. SM1_7_51]